MTSPVKTRREGAVLEITLDRPKANAIDLQTSRILGDTFAAFRDDPDLRVAIITGEGSKFFCPGWDLKAAADGDEVLEVGGEPVGGDRPFGEPADAFPGVFVDDRADLDRPARRSCAT